MVIKLYRGLSALEFKGVTSESMAANRRDWNSILKLRARGDHMYPRALDSAIQRLHREGRWERQYFTDSKEIAKSYARKMGGTLLEVSVPVKDILKHFDLEFQNFGRRKKKFEVVYLVKGAILAKRRKAWRLRVIQP